MERKLIGDYERLHTTTTDYGATGYKCMPFLLPHILALRPRSMIDYGCGRSDLAARLGRKAAIPAVAGYDPGVPHLSRRPDEMFDLLVNVDVLEHVPDDELDSVMAEMAAMARHAIIVIDTAPARTLLSDGRNAHVSLHDGEEWLCRLRPHFPTIRPIRIKRHARVGFKTWEAALPPLRHGVVEARERVYRLGTKLRRML
jgi:hypothetical protein